MTKDVVPTRSFAKDLKRLARQKKSAAKLEVLVDALSKNTGLPVSARPHKLQGEWADTWECHVEPDWLLLYTYTDTTLTLVRTGSHRDLFS